MVNCVMADQGKYECHLSNEVGSVTGVCDVTVHKIYKPPHFARQLNDVKQIKDCDARFICEGELFVCTIVSSTYVVSHSRPENLEKSRQKNS